MEVSTIKPLYFYGVNDEYYCFSNFYPCTFSDANNVYNCSEQYFMKKKQELFDPTNDKLAKDILENTDPAIIKNLGRSVKNYNDEEWNNVRLNHMTNGLILKFSQNDDLKKILLDTKNTYLVEASKYDKIWGIGISIADAKAGKKWDGQNLLGIALMNVREILLEQ
jgi:ribA/ribD-fused uncharacterized protein